MINNDKTCPVRYGAGGGAHEEPGDESIELMAGNGEHVPDTSTKTKSTQTTGRMGMIRKYEAVPNITPDRVFIVLAAVLLVLVIALTIVALSSESNAFTKWAGVVLCISSISLVMLILFYKRRDSQKLMNINNVIDDNVETRVLLDGAVMLTKEYREGNDKLRDEIEKCHSLIVSLQGEVGHLDRLSRERQKRIEDQKEKIAELTNKLGKHK